MNNHVTNAHDYANVFQTALNEGNLERILELYDADATMRAPDGQVGVGFEAVRAEMSNLIEANAHIENRLRYALVHDDTALIVVDWTLDLTPPHGKLMRQEGTATNVIRFDEVNGWRMIVANPGGVAKPTKIEP